MSTILVVDGDEMILALCSCILAELSDARILTARPAREALCIVTSGGIAIDLLLSDICMPGEMDGVQLAARCEEVQPSIKILLMSGYWPERLSFRAAWRYLPKPFPVVELLAKVRQATGMRSWVLPALQRTPVRNRS